MAREPGQLTERQQRFVAAFAASGNATDSARKAGYSDPNIGRQLITNPNVASAIASTTQKRKSALVADRDEREQFLSKVVRGKQRGADMKDRLKATELLSRMHGDFLERHEIVSGSLIDVLVYVPSNARG